MPIRSTHIRSHASPYAVSIDAQRGGVVDIPTGLGWTPTAPIARAHGRVYRPSIDPSTRMITPTNTYYVTTSGSDVASGTSEGAAFRSVWKAINTAGVTASTIYVKAGRYDYENAVSGLNVAFNMNLIGYGGRVVLTTQPSSVSWSDAGSGAWSTTYASTPYGVVDESNLDDFGVGTWLTARASVASVQASGGWFWSAGTLTIKTFDARTPDASIIAPLSSSSRWSLRIVTGVSAYVSGIDFLGGYRCDVNNVAQFTSVDCTFGYAEYIGCEVVTATETQHWRARAIGTYGTGGAGGDGLGYQAASAGNGLEVDCVCNSNGWDGVGISNGSSAHGSRVIRCGGSYLNNDGPNIADVNSGKSLLLGCYAGYSRASGSNKVNIATDGVTGELWAADCLLNGSATYDVASLNAASVVRLRSTATRRA
jgi:hypothetical protein